jgi:MFS family permease
MSFTSADTAAADEAPRWRDVYLASAARGISGCGDFLAATALVLTLQTRGAGGMAVAAVLLASTVPLMLLAPLAGRLADRVDSRLLLVSTGLVQAVVCVALAFAGHPVTIVGLVAVLAAGFAVTQPAIGALVPDMVGRAHLPRAMAISQTAASLGMLAGPALAGVLVGQFGLRVPLLVDAASYLAIAVAGLLIRTRRGGRKGTARDLSTAATPTWRLRSDSLLLTLVVAVSVIIAAVVAVNVADVFFVRETLHASTTVYGLLGAVWIGSMLVGSWLAARVLSRGSDGALAIGMLGALASTSALIALSATVQHALWLVPLWVVGGVLNGGENVTANVVIARRVRAEVRGRAIGIFVGAVNAAQVVGYLLGGALLEVWTPRTLIAVSGLAGLVVVVICVAPLVRAARVTAGAPGESTVLAGS